jgi:hypothetical protein
MPDSLVEASLRRTFLAWSVHFSGSMQNRTSQGPWAQGASKQMSRRIERSARTAPGAYTVQPARSRRLRLAFCTLNRGLAESGLLTRPGISRSWRNRKCEANGCRHGVCELSEGDSTELDSLPLYRCAALAHHKQGVFPSNSVGPLSTMESPRRGDLFAWRFCRGSGRDVVREIYGYRYG